MWLDVAKQKKWLLECFMAWFLLVDVGRRKKRERQYLSLTFSVGFSSFFQKEGGKFPVDQFFFSLLFWRRRLLGNFVDQKKPQKSGEGRPVRDKLELVGTNLPRIIGFLRG